MVRLTAASPIVMPSEMTSYGLDKEMSQRRFMARCSGVSLGATGWVSP